MLQDFVLKVHDRCNHHAWMLIIMQGGWQKEFIAL